MIATSLRLAGQPIGCSHPIRADVTELADPGRVMLCLVTSCGAEWSEPRGDE